MPNVGWLIDWLVNEEKEGEGGWTGPAKGEGNWVEPVKGMMRGVISTVQQTVSRDQWCFTLNGGSVGGALSEALKLQQHSGGDFRCCRLTHLVRLGDIRVAGDAGLRGLLWFTVRWDSELSACGGFRLRNAGWWQNDLWLGSGAGDVFIDCW